MKRLLDSLAAGLICAIIWASVSRAWTSVSRAAVVYVSSPRIVGCCEDAWSPEFIQKRIEHLQRRER